MEADLVRTAGRLAIVAGCLAVTIGCTQAEPLAPMTKLKLSVVNFVASTGEYRSWDAIGGELVVSNLGTVFVPTIGTIETNDLSTDQLGAEISQRLQTKLGLLNAPDATVQIVEYPPIYIVGGVATPGKFPFNPGMTVLQAVALGGGEFRAPGLTGQDEQITLQGEFVGLNNGLRRSAARIARFEAELSDAETIAFPASLNEDDPLASSIITQELAIFAARRNEKARQLASLSELREIYRAEIDVLDEKIQIVEQQLARAETQLNDVINLVAAGTATVSRQNEIERTIGDLRADRLDGMIARMRAREGLSETERSVARLEDTFISEVSAALQSEEASNDTLLVRRTTLLQLLNKNIEAMSDLEQTQVVEPTYTLVRRVNGELAELPATESTELLAGDVLKVLVSQSPLGATVGSTSDL